MNDASSSQPPRESSVSWWVALAGALVSFVFLANPGWGIWEFIPDIIPVIGNIDEAVLTACFIACLSRLGIDIIPGIGRKRKDVIDHPPRDKN